MGWLKNLVGGGDGPTKKHGADSAPQAASASPVPPDAASNSGDEDIDVDQLNAQTKSRWERVQQQGTEVQAIMETVEENEKHDYKALLGFSGKFHPISNRSLLGRHSKCNVIVRGDGEISRQHATVRISGSGGLEVQDHGSVNGTYVNGNPVPKKTWVELQTGDRLNLGSRVAFTVVVNK